MPMASAQNLLPKSSQPHRAGIRHMAIGSARCASQVAHRADVVAPDEAKLCGSNYSLHDRKGGPYEQRRALSKD